MLPGSDAPIAPTHWSFGQFAGLVGAPAAYLRQLPAPLAGINLQYGLTSHRTDDDRSEFLRKRGFSKTETAKIIETVLTEEGRKPESVFDFVQGITAVVRMAAVEIDAYARSPEPSDDIDEFLRCMRQRGGALA